MLTSIHYASKRILPYISTYAEMTYFDVQALSLETYVDA